MSGSVGYHGHCLMLASVGLLIPHRSKRNTVRYSHAGAKEERRYGSYSFLTSALDVGDWSVTPQPRFTPRERTPSTHCTGGWVGLRASLDTEARGKILCLCRGSKPVLPICSQTLYWLSNPSQAPPITHRGNKLSFYINVSQSNGLAYNNKRVLYASLQMRFYLVQINQRVL
jgi:hypothetical protein